MRFTRSLIVATAISGPERVHEPSEGSERQKNLALGRSVAGHDDQVDVNTAVKDLLFSTLRIRSYQGERLLQTGTGFVLDLELTEGHVTPVLVTNKHVIADADRVDIEFFVADDHGGVVLGQTGKVRVANGEQAFLGHPAVGVDVAVSPIGRVMQKFPAPLFYRAIPASFLPTSSALRDLDAIEDLIFVGYPDGRWDEVNKTPIARRAITATPIELDFDGRPCFLLDGSVFAGSSGSPVLIYNSGGFSVGGQFAVGHRMILVGVITETLTREVSIGAGALEHVLRQEINLGVAANWRAIDETIEALCDHAGLTRVPPSPRR